MTNTTLDILSMVVAAPFVIAAGNTALDFYDNTPLLQQVIKVDGVVGYGVNQLQSKTDPIYRSIGLPNPLAIRSVEDAKNFLASVGESVTNNDDQIMAKLNEQPVVSRLMGTGYIASNHSVTKVY